METTGASGTRQSLLFDRDIPVHPPVGQMFPLNGNFTRKSSPLCARCETLLSREQKHLGHEVGGAFQDFPVSKAQTQQNLFIQQGPSSCRSKPSSNADLSEDLTRATTRVGVKVA